MTLAAPQARLPDLSRNHRQRSRKSARRTIITMEGMNARTGRSISGINHLRQSLSEILTTPIGTRVMRRDFGSRLYELVDAPMNNATLLDLYSATAEALVRWEPRFRLTRIQVSEARPGHVTLRLQGEYRPTQEPVDLDGVEVA